MTYITSSTHTPLSRSYGAARRDLRTALAIGLSSEAVYPGRLAADLAAFASSGIKVRWN